MPNSKIQRIFSIVLIGAAGAVLLFISGCAVKSEEPKAKADNEPATAAKDNGQSVQQKVLSFNLEGFTQKGTKSWEVRGESAEAISASEIRLDNIVAKAYGDEAEATITADKGVYDKAKNNVRLKENVKATIENSERFADDFGGLAHSAAPKPRLLNQGENRSLRVNPEQAPAFKPERVEELTAPIPASAKKDNKDTAEEKRKRRISITCAGDVEFDYGKNEAYFDKDVKIISEDGNIDADKIIIKLDPGTKKLQEIIANGNVSITRGENITYSDKATYVTADKKIILTGRPKLVIYQEGGIESGFPGE